MNDQLIVTKLRPMSEDPGRDEDVLLYLKNRKEFVIGWREDRGRYYVSDEVYLTVDKLEGWIPIPIYKPET